MSMTGTERRLLKKARRLKTEIEKLTALSGDHPRYIGWVPIERVLQQKP